jgi:hypothetical protein
MYSHKSGYRLAGSTNPVEIFVQKTDESARIYLGREDNSHDVPRQRLPMPHIHLIGAKKRGLLVPRYQ